MRPSSSACSRKARGEPYPAPAARSCPRIATGLAPAHAPAPNATRWVGEARQPESLRTIRTVSRLWSAPRTRLRSKCTQWGSSGRPYGAFRAQRLRSHPITVLKRCIQSAVSRALAEGVWGVGGCGARRVCACEVERGAARSGSGARGGGKWEVGKWEVGTGRWGLGGGRVRRRQDQRRGGLAYGSGKSASRAQWSLTGSGTARAEPRA